MKSLYLLLPFILCFSFQSWSQTEITTNEELIEYLEGEWQLRKRIGGFGGETACFPQSTLDYRLSFMPIENSDSTMMYTNFKNQTLLVESIVSISFDENYDWKLDDLYFPELFAPLPFFIYKEVASIDTLWFGGGCFDCYSYMFSKDIVSNTAEPVSTYPKVKVFPNPTFQFVEITGIEISDIKRIMIYSEQGQLQTEITDIISSRIELPNVTSLFIMKILMKDGSQIVKTVSKLSNN